MKLRRLFSFLLTMALLVSLLAVPAFAADKTLTLREDWRLTGELDLNVPEGDTLTITGNGYYIYEFTGQLTNSGLGKVVFSEGTILYPAGTSTACTTETSNQLMLERQPHKVTVSSAENGAVATDAADGKATKGTTITLTITPSSGYQLGTLTVTAVEDNDSPVAVSGDDNRRTFTMPASDVTIAATFTAEGTPAVPAAPTFSPAGGTYTSAQNVTITAVDGATIYYTTDGDTPTTSSTQYTGAISIASTTTLKAIAVKDGVSSTVTSATYTISTSSGNSGGTSGNSSNTTTTTERNPDGSTTTTTTNKATGTVTETTRYPDGSREVVETKRDGTVTTTTTDTDGNETAVVENPDGTREVRVEQADGTSASAVADQVGRIQAEVSLSSRAVSAAQEDGGAVTLPIPEVSVSDSSEDASLVEIDLPRSAGAVKVEIPTEDAGPGTVAVIVNEDGTETVVKKSVALDGGIVFTLETDATVKIVDNSKDFDDTYGHWAEDAIDFATAHEMFGGTSADTFSPDTPMTRGMLAVVLHRFEDTPNHTFTGSFEDVASGSWYADGIHWMADNGIIGGYGNGNFGADDSITREQLATILYRYADVMGYGTSGSASLDRFSDVDNVSGYAVEAMGWAVENGLIGGMGDGTLAPQGSATRAQIATTLMRFVENLVN